VTTLANKVAAAHAEQRPSCSEAAAQAAAAETSAPRRVIRGAKCQTAISVDWLRVVGPAATLDRAMRYIDEIFGEDSRKYGKGLWFYEASQRYASGVIIAYDVSKDDEHSTFAVEVPGQALANLTYDERVKMLDRLLWFGCHCTRLDVALDVKSDDGVYLAECVRDACKYGELTRAKTWREMAQHSGDEQTGLTVYMGQRGDLGSGRFVRVYDKGLETQTLPGNRWQRWETEFSGEVASEVAKVIASSANWTDDAFSYALGAVEFREPNGQRLSRRPVSQWWTDFFSSVELKRVRITREDSSLETFAVWLNRCVGPTLATMANLRGVNLADVFLELVGKASPVMQGAARPVVWEYLKQHGIVEQPKLAEAC